MYLILIVGLLFGALVTHASEQEAYMAEASKLIEVASEFGKIARSHQDSLVVVDWNNLPVDVFIHEDPKVPYGIVGFCSDRIEGLDNCEETKLRLVEYAKYCAVPVRLAVVEQDTPFEAEDYEWVGDRRFMPFSPDKEFGLPTIYPIHVRVEQLHPNMFAMTHCKRPLF